MFYLIASLCYLNLGDEKILESARVVCFANIDKDARDEGTDYDGDCRVFSFLPKGDKALKRDESTTKLSEVRMVIYFLFYFSLFVKPCKVCVCVCVCVCVWVCVCV